MSQPLNALRFAVGDHSLREGASRRRGVWPDHWAPGARRRRPRAMPPASGRGVRTRPVPMASSGVLRRSVGAPAATGVAGEAKAQCGQSSQARSGGLDTRTTSVRARVPDREGHARPEGPGANGLHSRTPRHRTIAPARSAPRKRRYRLAHAHHPFAFRCQFARYNPLESLNRTRPNGSQMGPIWDPSPIAYTSVCRTAAVPPGALARWQLKTDGRLALRTLHVCINRRRPC
jgi:hypothetical protein